MKYKLQSGIPHRIRSTNDKPGGLLLKGVVLATYVTDSPEHPSSNDTTNSPVMSYCDVLIYTNIAYNRWFILNKVMVSQLHGGLHNDDIWKPKATTKNILENLNDTIGANPGSLDGDHVLVGFVNNSYSEPIILRGIPHPSRDVFNSDFSIGKRIKLKLVDGNPFYIKHNGIFFGVDDSGDFSVNSSFATKGNTLETGEEILEDNSGNQSFILPDISKFSIIFNNMINALSPIEAIKLEIKKDDNNLVFSLNGENIITLNGGGNSAEMTIGSGVAHPAIADKLKLLWNTFRLIFNNHTHPILEGITGLPSTIAPNWDEDISGKKVSFSDN
jgi:hypothetical protein